jgi:hypothetical protein
LEESGGRRNGGESSRLERENGKGQEEMNGGEREQTLVWIEMSALSNKKTDAFLAFDISVGLCAKAGDGEADEAKAVVVADGEIYIGLSVWIREKELEDRVFSKEAGAVETVVDEDGLLIWVEAGVGG